MSFLGKFKRGKKEQRAEKEGQQFLGAQQEKTQESLKKNDTKVHKSNKKESGKKKQHTKKGHSAYEVLMHPIITEKATMTGTFIFQVHVQTNKSEVIKAIEELYGITPKSVRMINVRGKQVRWNYRYGKKSSWKKAIVQLPEGETINVYEGT